MKIGMTGTLENERQVRAGFIGCGSHSFRNLYPTFQFASVDLQAVCDLDQAKADAFARQFGAHAAYTDYREMLAQEGLDVVFICAGYRNGRPLYPDLAVGCLEAGCHVWIEKPPAGSCAEIERMQQAAGASGKTVMVGLKKMFFPANVKAKALAGEPDFGSISHVMLEYPQSIPTVQDFADYRAGGVNGVVSFLDHLCHPASLLLLLAGMPDTLYYTRNRHGGGVALFTYDTGITATIAFTHGASPANCGQEFTKILSDSGRHITVENGIRLTYHRTPPSKGYGKSPDYFLGSTEQVSAVWEPEFSLGQLYNKGLFLLGYYGEIQEMAEAVLENRVPVNGTLEQAWQVTRIFEAFAEGPEKQIRLS